MEQRPQHDELMTMTTTSDDIDAILDYYDSTAWQDRPGEAGDPEHRDALITELALAAIGRDRELLALLVREACQRGRGDELLEVVAEHREQAASAEQQRAELDGPAPPRPAPAGPATTPKRPREKPLGISNAAVRQFADRLHLRDLVDARTRLAELLRDAHPTDKSPSIWRARQGRRGLDILVRVARGDKRTPQKLVVVGIIILRGGSASGTVARDAAG